MLLKYRSSYLHNHPSCIISPLKMYTVQIHTSTKSYLSRPWASANHSSTIFLKRISLIFVYTEPFPVPEGANCFATDELSWCLLFVNYANNGQTASAEIVSTFVQRGNLYTGKQGEFIVHATGGI